MEVASLMRTTMILEAVISVVNDFGSQTYLEPFK